MKIFLAGVPAGYQADREHHIKRLGAEYRLTTFYYLRQAEITLKNYKGSGKVVDSRREEYEVFIGRGATSLHHYGNPFIVGQHGSKRDCVQKFHKWLKGEYPSLEPERRRWVLENVEGLKGKVLGCFCASPPCHGYVLLELAERMYNNKNKRGGQNGKRIF